MTQAKSRLYKLKDWYSLQDATKRVSLTFGEEITENDLLQLVVENTIRLSWYIRGRPARRLASTEATPPHPDQETISELEGPHHFETKEASHTRDWIMSLITDKRGSLQSSVYWGGLTVWDKEGFQWEIVRRVTDEEKKDNAESFTDFEASVPVADDDPIKMRWLSDYIRETTWPDRSELGFQRVDLEELENGGKESPSSLGARAETTYLNIIGTMLALLLGKTPNGKKSAPYGNETAVIAKLLEDFPKEQGLSKRTLEDKFARAKGGLNNNVFAQLR